MLTRTPWPPDYVEAFALRQQQLLEMGNRPVLVRGAKEYYSQPEHLVEFIEDWCETYDPRNAGTDIPTRMPFLLFPRQRELLEYLVTLLKSQQNGLIEKCRDMGATWICVAFSVWLWLFWPGASVGWGSRKADLVDRIGDADSIFEKIRILLNSIPPEFLPSGFNPLVHATYMRVVNPDNGASITGESGDNIGRGGRKLIYFKDESAHYEHPESIEAALTDNTRVQIDISSVNGLGNVFHRKREAGIDWEGKIVRGKTHIFIMDWRDHPGKTQQWYDERRQTAEDNGLLHLFAQEVERNYAASVEGTIIPMAWIKSAIDAHEKIDFDLSGGWCAGLDVADGGGDKNALAKRRGSVLMYLDEWGERDTGVTARRALVACSRTSPIQLYYDCIGVGSGVKAEFNRLMDDEAMPKDIQWHPWDAGSSVVNPDDHVIQDDHESPKNKDFYTNLKAQAWWSMRRRFERTHRAITEGVSYPTDELISISSELPKLRQLEKELCQPTAGQGSRLKLMVNKMPKGTHSPNLADAVVMCYFPVSASGYDASWKWV